MKHLTTIFLLGLFFLFSLTKISAQTEDSLKNFFEGRYVEAKIDMPATKDGIDVYPERDRNVNFGKYGNRLKQNGIGIEEGDRVMITKVKVKGKHIEFQLGGGGYGTFGDETNPTIYVPTINKSDRERRLERNLKNEPDRWRRRKMREELDYLRREREIENARNRAEVAPAEEIAKIRIQEKRLQAGSRFNIRFDRKVSADDLTPEAIMDALSEYLYFSEND